MRPMALIVAALLPVGSFHTAGQSSTGDDALAGRLTDGQAIFGIFSGEKTAEQGAQIAEIADLDFIFYSLERGPFDLP